MLPKSFKVSNPAVECQSVTKKFFFYEHRSSSLKEAFIRLLQRKPVHVKRPEFMLSDFDLSVPRGGAVALIGSNGSGKSTALRLIAGVYQPTQGRVVVRGKVAAVIELGAGFHPDLTGEENARLYGAVMGLSRQEISERMPQIKQFADIGNFLDVPVKYYSSGMQARLAFAVTVCVEPDILLLDEVLAVGDQTFRARCMEKLKSFRRNGGTIIVVSHDLDTAAELCDTAVWIDKGQVRMTGDISEVRQAYEDEA